MIFKEGIAGKIQVEADETVALNVPLEFMGAVGAYYEEFDQVSDEEVISLLRHVPSNQKK
ncbi:MAG: hypothetical protein AAB881_00315 [Patescibacteria group bacterium]